MNKEMREKQVEDFYDKIAAGYQETHGFRISDAILKHFLLANLPPKKQLTILGQI